MTETNTIYNDHSNQHLRIACLEPSATAICRVLGLTKYIVGVTHECPYDEVLSEKQTSIKTAEDSLICSNTIHVLTRNGLKVESQGEIHEAVSIEARARKNDPYGHIPSLYPLAQDEWILARPNIVFTQDLCAVCAPTTIDVMRLVEDDDEAKIVSLQPETLHDVADTFVTVAETCGIREKGVQMRDEFLNNLKKIKEVVSKYRDPTKGKPRIFVLEWLDPPFDTGHWTIQMMNYADVEQPSFHQQQRQKEPNNNKSKQITWDYIYESDPDCIIVGCCGFDLKRNIQDTLTASSHLRLLRAAKENKIFACNGNLYIAQPAPSLLVGTAMLAQCAYHDQPRVLEEINKLDFMSPKTNDVAPGWERVKIATSSTDEKNSIPDIEDIVPPPSSAASNGSNDEFGEMHRQACEAGKMHYIDPATGYHVFTELGHKQRGKCCGSGCRHCPYHHENVRDKASKIQQPSMLHMGTSDLFSLTKHTKIKVLFFSGGKDSFLTIRALVRSYYQQPPNKRFGLVLLTTFDATTRIIAHQEVHIEKVMEQAKHLDISLVGIPLRRASGETYADRIRGGLKVVEYHLNQTGENNNNLNQITTLVFGDLHLEHIRTWRDSTLIPEFGYELEYPLWKVPYETLLDDLSASKVPCMVAASTHKDVQAGTMYNRELYEKVVSSSIDGFGENGEFHSLAQVWNVSRETALGIA